MTKKQSCPLVSFCAGFLKMFTGACKKYREIDWQLVASYFTVKSTNIFYSVKLTETGWAYLDAKAGRPYYVRCP